ncbi:unnamed protein product [Mesocestoides corti]|uniref:C2H2-type domain-containing protein n=1 Tax=Mesocestoides corti TaxID=53468 RepID=A0A0R3UJB1_MESCO|nr:unnamed protein product [Mesocestoides corti]
MEDGGQLEAWTSTARDINCGICGSTLNRDESAHRHVYFHAWLVFLYARGTFYQENEGWPICQLPEAFSSIPDFPTPFCCAWRKCRFQTNDVADLYNHVSQHPRVYEDVEGPKNCQWEGCKYACERLRNLVTHLRSHTQEKALACPQCGFLFTAKMKLRDHLVRQQPVESSAVQFQCSYCHRVFGNKSLLQAHANRHINKHKCPQCNLTLHSKSAIRRHILYRHTTKATVQCPHCPAKFKDTYLLRSHTSRRHNSSGVQPHRSTTAPIGPLAVAGSPGLSTTAAASSNYRHLRSRSISTEVFRCPETDCKFYSITRPGLCVHMGRKHASGRLEGSYACHLCPMRTHKGFLLSRHLISKHNCQHPSGHYRFNYVLSPEDGLYRLQTTRLDSVEVAKALLGPQTVDQLIGSVTDHHN